MTYKKLIDARGAINYLSNLVDKDEKEGKIKDYKVLKKIALLRLKTKEAFEIYEKMERGVRNNFKDRIQKAKQNDIDMQLINDELSDAYNEIQQEEILADINFEAESLPKFEDKELEKLNLPASIISELLSIGCLEV